MPLLFTGAAFCVTSYTLKFVTEVEFHYRYTKEYIRNRIPIDPSIAMYSNFILKHSIPQSISEIISKVKYPDVKTQIGADAFPAHDMNVIFV
jgi:hypothetical protein